MQPRLSFLTLGVTDLDRSRRFYRDVLGWPLSPKSQDGIAFFQLNGFVLALYPRDALAEDANVDMVAERHPRIALAHNVRERLEVDALLDELAAKGASIAKPAEDAFWGGRSGYFADPDGFMWEVAWNPHGLLDEQGNFLLEP